MAKTRISNKYQIVMPKSVREKLGLIETLGVEKLFS